MRCSTYPNSSFEILPQLEKFIITGLSEKIYNSYHTRPVIYRQREDTKSTVSIDGSPLVLQYIQRVDFREGVNPGVAPTVSYRAPID